ncbi:hypothetical protein Bca52824_012226 [Brassica carinata]|uniref:Uncharacterized protein n=1 Tax=Brassica carinata TaxID=52824 RepID=A0A8X8B269_BRACI|nr:hypothetical protein Bca52824_012226 [Brassica carinata]
MQATRRVKCLPLESLSGRSEKKGFISLSKGLGFLLLFSVEESKRKRRGIQEAKQQLSLLPRQILMIRNLPRQVLMIQRTKPKKHHKSKRQKKRKEIETTSDPSEIERGDVKKLKVDYLSPKSSSSESECEGWIFFFNGKPVRVDIHRFINQPSQSVIVFGSVQDTKGALKLSGKLLRDIAIYVKPNGKQSRNTACNWVQHSIDSKRDQETTSFWYIYIDPQQGVDEDMLMESFEIDGRPINVSEATPKLCFEAEIVGKNNFFKEVNDEDEKTALKRMLLPLPTRLPDLLYTQTRTSWTDKRPDITAESYAQESNDCWDAALQRAYAALLALSDLEGPGYVKEMKIYRCPRGAGVSSYEDFEIFILQLLAETPVMVTIEYLPGFESFDGQSIRHGLSLENIKKFPIQCLLLTGQ